MAKRKLVDAALRRSLHRWGFAAVRHRGTAPPVTLYRYRLPASLSWAGHPGRLEIPLSNITTAAGFSFGNGGWHPHVETLRWLARTEHAHPEPEHSPLGRLYAVFHPETAREAIFDDHDDPMPGLTDVPLVRGQLRELWNPYGARSGKAHGMLDRPGLYWGPAPRAYVTTEIERTLKVYDSLAATGHRDAGPQKNAISGYLLVRGDDYRFVVHQGHHRLACLAALRRSCAPVYLSPKVPPVIDADDLARWTEGSHPRYTPASARLLFTRLFESTGLEKATRLGLEDGSKRPTEDD